MITANSRYAQNEIVTFDVHGNSRQVIEPAAPAAVTFTYFSHVYSGDETIDGLAYRYFGDPAQWWQIANVNPEIILWRDLIPGTTIRIPTF